MSTVSEKLAAIADEIEQHPERWTQGAYARDKDGTDVGLDRSADAVCWCALGLTFRDEVDRTTLYAVVESIITERSVSHWNDAPGRTAAEVAAAFRRASSLAKENE
jgi:hypothetical protein